MEERSVPPLFVENRSFFDTFLKLTYAQLMLV